MDVVTSMVIGFAVGLHVGALWMIEAQLKRIANALEKK